MKNEDYKWLKNFNFPNMLPQGQERNLDNIYFEHMYLYFSNNLV